MAKRLQEHINSTYLELASRLRPRNAARKVVAYVESYDDVFFWRTVLQDFESDRLRFEVMLPSRHTLSKGKKAAMMNQLGPSLGNYMIACVDADYDYLVQGATGVSRALLSSPYILHTYAYAIENYQCYAPSLHAACVMSTLNDRSILSPEAFLQQYSLTVWPLFVWSIWAHRNGQASTFSITDMAQLITFHDINPWHPEHALEQLKKRVDKKIAWLQRRFPKAKESYLNLRKSLQEELDIRPSDTYLYVQGHALMDGVVLPLLTPVCNILRREREKEITQLALHSVQKQNELAGYRHSLSPIELMLRKSTAFKQSEPYRKLSADIGRLTKKLLDGMDASTRQAKEAHTTDKE